MSEHCFVPGDLVVHSLSYYMWNTPSMRGMFGPGMVIHIDQQGLISVVWSVTGRVATTTHDRIEAFNEEVVR